MEIQKGIVKYKDRTDIVCEYGIVSDKQYYFMPDGKLSNGNIVATTTLVEAIDMEVQPTTIGLISPEGKELIPFENKSIKPINDQYLLVEKARPTSVSVISALSSRSDPLAATRLVTTAATKKESLMTNMGAEGKFIFNDQFSEASVFTNDGVNVLNGEYYSFIGLNHDNLYYSTNLLEDAVLSYSFIRDHLSESQVLNSDTVKPEIGSLDVTDVGASQEEIASSLEEAMRATQVLGSDTENGDEIVNPEVDTVSSSSDVLNEVEDQEKLVPLDQQEATHDTVSDHVEVESQEMPEEKDESLENFDQEEVFSGNEDNKEDVVSFEEEIVDDVNKEDTKIQEENGSYEEQVIDNDSIKEELNIGDDSKEEVMEDFKLSADRYNMERTEREVPMKKSYYTDKEFNRDYDLDDTYYEPDHSNRNFEGDTIIKDVATTMTELIRQNKEQRSKILSLEKRNEALDDKVINLDNVVSKLESQKQSLENRNEQMNEKIHNQNNVIDRQRDEIEHLKIQLQGKKDLVRLLNDAQSVLRSDVHSYDYDDEREYSYRRVA